MQLQRQKLQDARTRINEAKKRMQQLESRLPALKRQLQERAVAVNGLTEQVARETTAVAQLAQQTEGKANDVLRVQSELEQLRQEVVYNLQQTRQQIEERCSSFETELQEHSIAIAGAVERVESDKKTVSQISTETSARATTILQAQSELEKLRGDSVSALSTLQQIEERIQEQYRNFEKQLQSREMALQELASLVERDKATVSQALQQTENKTGTILQVRSELENLRGDMVSSLEEIQHLIEERCRVFETQLQSREVALEGLASLVEKDKTTVSQLVRETESITATGRQVQSELEQLRQDIVSVANELGGKEGLEALRNEQVQASLATQETASRVEQMREEVSSLAQQVRADREAIQSWSASPAAGNNLNVIDASVRELRDRHDRLRSQVSDTKQDLGQKLQSLEQTAQRLGNGLLGIRCFCVGIAISLAIALLREWL